MNEVCGNMPDVVQKQSNWLFECVGGPKTGRYATFQLKHTGATSTLREVYFDHMQAIPEQSMMKGRQKALFIVLKAAWKASHGLKCATQRYLSSKPNA